jgi:predicted site-specific integrase-resolvase
MEVHVSMEQTQRLFRASDLARWCGVDLKTIHNWVTRGKLTAFRSPGRRIRVTFDVARAFLERHGYPLPKELQ